jgi:hypothetical protein
MGALGEDRITMPVSFGTNTTIIGQPNAAAATNSASNSANVTQGIT